MANKRMFSLLVIDTDIFLDMPLSTQALYFHLSMRADDDGFIGNAKKIQRMIGASEDDFKLLLAKSFMFKFDTGVCVVKHWRIHNYIQKDRYTKTIYKNEKEQLTIDNNNVYQKLDTECIQDVSEVFPQVRLGKVRIDIDKDKKDIYVEIKNSYLDLCVSFPKVRAITSTDKGHINSLLKDFSLEEIKATFEKANSVPFLSGKNNTSWKADFHWIVNINNFTKVFEGRYDNIKNEKEKKKVGHEGYDLDMSKYERL
jgi:hypothetical protein